MRQLMQQGPRGYPVPFPYELIPFILEFLLKLLKNLASDKERIVVDFMSASIYGNNLE